MILILKILFCRDYSIFDSNLPQSAQKCGSWMAKSTRFPVVHTAHDKLMMKIDGYGSICNIKYIANNDILQ